MMNGAKARLDGSRLLVRIRMRFQRRGGRNRIVAADGSDIVPASKPQPDGTLLKALARAWRWQRMLESGDAERWPNSRTPNGSVAPMSVASCGSRF